MESKSQKSTHINTAVEVTAVLLILILALFFRFWRLDSVPPGLHFDEAIDVRQGLHILDGARPIYITEGWGREALYYYALAGVMTVVADNVLALRVTAVLLSLLTLLITYLFIRRQTNPLTAWFTIAWFSVTFWPLFTSRFGVRNISLPFLFSLTLLAFWWGWGKLRQRREGAKGEKIKEAVLAYLPAGALLGLTFYTYQPARFVPILFAAFFLYLLLFHRQAFRAQFWGFVTFGSVAALVALPLVLAILHNPISGEADRAWTIEPMTQLLAGNLQPVWQNAIATLKMFTISGDPLNSYNVPGRPLFQPGWTGLFFYAGLLIALWRWKQPFYAFVLLWLGIMIAPTTGATGVAARSRGGSNSSV
jgi:4-amino-4-deoxy-L-arabinose transferase-like glycosyltransferase